jgi:hypothetical protein
VAGNGGVITVCWLFEARLDDWGIQGDRAELAKKQDSL